MNTVVASELFGIVKTIFDKNNISFWPMYGTLLGFIRDKGFIEWDDDIDIGCWWYDYDTIVDLKNEVETNGCSMSCKTGRYSVITITRDDVELVVIFWIRDNDTAVSMLYKNDTCWSRWFDGLGRLFTSDYYQRRQTRIPQHIRDKVKQIVTRIPRYWYNRCSETLHRLHMYTYKKMIMPYHQYNKQKTIQVDTWKIGVPFNYKEYLRLSYGDDWRIPNKGWSSSDEQEKNKTYQRYMFKNPSNRKEMVQRWNKN